MEHEQWIRFQDRVLARLPRGVPPTNEEEWKAFHSRVLAHPVLQWDVLPEGPEEDAQFREYILEQFLVRCWCDSVCVSLIMEDKWVDFEHQLPKYLQPLTLEDMKAEKWTLRYVHARAEQMKTYGMELMKLWTPPDVNIEIELWEKQIAWRIASQEQARKRRSKSTKSAREPPEADPASIPELLLAVQIATEEEMKEEVRWRDQIMPYIPAALRPTSTLQWMQMDCRVLAQMPLQPRLDVAGGVTGVWLAKQRHWEEWEILTALKLLARRWVDEGSRELPSSSYDRPWITLAARYTWKRRLHWKQRIIAQMPPRVRPRSLDDWKILEIKFCGRHASDQVEDWEKMICWMLEADDFAWDEEEQLQEELWREKYAVELEKEARQRAADKKDHRNFRMNKNLAIPIANNEPTL